MARRRRRRPGPRLPCAWVRCAKGSWRAGGVSAGVSDQAWREAAQSSLGTGRAWRAAVRVCVRAAAVDVAQMRRCAARAAGEEIHITLSSI